MEQGTRLAARPTMYKGIQMRSRLEARYAAWLDRCGFDWQYEPQCFANEEGQYLPDFLIRSVPFLHSERDLYVEVRPTIAAATDRSGASVHFGDAARILFASRQDALFALECAELPTLMVFTPPEIGLNLLDMQWASDSAGHPRLMLITQREWRKAG